MAAIAHLGLGLAAKPVASRVPVGVLVLATEATDLLWGVLALAGVENTQSSPWSHSLFTSVILAALAGLLAARLYRHRPIGAVIGLAVFSHWLLDFVVHPPDLPLLFNGSPTAGLGLYTSGPGVIASIALELGLLAGGRPLPAHSPALDCAGTMKGDRP